MSRKPETNISSDANQALASSRYGFSTRLTRQSEDCLLPAIESVLEDETALGAAESL